MKKNYTILSLLFLFITLNSCSENDEDAYLPLSNENNKQITTTKENAPITIDLTQVPFPKLSDYHFFIGELKNQKPGYKVIPYQPASSLFSDYALKKRFIWMPNGVKATYNGDGSVLELPIGAALIKTFYYDKVQNITPVGGTRIIETRIMIRKASGWIFADYIWNTQQTEAYYDISGSYTQISWKDDNDVIKSTNYRIPSEEQCNVCHKFQQVVNNVLETSHIPIGIKPQNLNFNYNYGRTIKNQLTKWIEVGYLQNNFSFPSINNTTVDYSDTSKPLDVRARSYVDANCAHCHQNNRHCDYRQMRFAFSESANNLTNMGVCVNTEDMQDFPPELNKIVNPRNINMSMLYYRINTTNESFRMPLHGRTVIHEEGVALIREWINSLSQCE